MRRTEDSGVLSAAAVAAIMRDGGSAVGAKLAAFLDCWRAQGPRAAGVRTLEFLAYRLRERGVAGRLAGRLYDWYYDLPRTGWKVTFVGPQDVGAQEVERSALLTAGPAGTSIWHAAGPETHDLGGSLLADLCHVPPGMPRPAMFDAPSYVSAPIHFVRFEQALVFPHWGVVMVEPGRIWRDSTSSARWRTWTLRGVPGVHKSREGLCILPRVARGKRLIERPCLLLAHRSHRNYGHFHFDCLPGVLAFRHELASGDLALLAPPLLAWQRALLRRLGVAEVIEAAAEAVRCRHLVFPSHHTGSGTPNPSTAVAAVLRAVAAGGERRHPANPAPLIYINRSDIFMGRIMENELQLAAALARHGFVSVNPRALGIDEQVGLFSAARIVVGAHGAGLTNIGFAPAGCTVIDIMPELIVEPWMFHLTALLGQRYIYIVAPVSASKRRRLRLGEKVRTDRDYSFSVDIDAVTRAVEGALATLGTANAPPA